MDKNFNFYGLELIVEENSTLLQAARWIAARIPPVSYKHEALTEKYWPLEDNLEDAKRMLYYQLMRGALNARGYECILVPHGDYSLYSKPDTALVPIEGDKWDYTGVEWAISGLKHSRAGWNGIVIKTMDLMRLFPTKDVSEIDPGSLTYTTPFMQLMLRAIEELKITKSNQQKTQDVQRWFENELLRMGEINPKNKTKLMTTFVRLPQSQKGGNKKVG